VDNLSLVHGILVCRLDLVNDLLVPLLIHPGDIFWLDGCPPLDGDRAERRPVIVVEDVDTLARGGPDTVVAATTSDCADPDRIDLPNQHDEPGTTTGLPRPCCALPRWCLLVPRSSLRDLAGRLPRVTLVALMAAVDARLDDMGPDMRVGQ